MRLMRNRWYYVRWKGDWLRALYSGKPRVRVGQIPLYRFQRPDGTALHISNIDDVRKDIPEMSTLKIPNDLFHEAVQDSGYELEDFRLNYSGRGMYGDTCIGIVSENAVGAAISFSIALFVNAFTRGDHEYLSSLRQHLENPSTDSLGRRQIAYWPEMQLEDPEDDNDEDDD